MKLLYLTDEKYVGLGRFAMLVRLLVSRMRVVQLFTERRLSVCVSTNMDKYLSLSFK